jgi:hypothetical protein
MLMRRATFDSLDCFDERYAPAYYEGVDLCGRRMAERWPGIVYEPRSLVTHERYASSTTARADKFGRRNRDIFVERWASDLAGRPNVPAPYPPGGAARDAMATQWVLICVSTEHPDARAVASELMVAGAFRNRTTRAEPAAAGT